MAAERFAKLHVNLSAIKKCDQYVVNIEDNASQVALYKFNGEKQAWVRIIRYMVIKINTMFNIYSFRFPAVSSGFARQF